MTIWHLVPSIEAGVERVIADLARAQRRAGHQVRVVSTRAGDAGPGAARARSIEELAHEGVELVSVGSLTDRDFDANLDAVRAIAANAGAARPHVLHTHGAVSTFIARLLAGAQAWDVPIVMTLHGWEAARTTGEAAWDVGLAHLADRVAVPSTHLAQVLASRGLAWAKLSVVPYGTTPARDAGQASDDAVEQALARARQGGRLIVGCPGSMGAAESHGLLLDALGRLGGHPAVTAVFTGDGDSGAMRRLAADVDGAEILVADGAVTARWFAAHTNAIVLPASDAGQAIWVLEAFDAGVVAIAAEGPGVRELVEDGATGVTFAEDDAGALAGALTRVADLPAGARDDLRRRAAARHARQYTAAAMARHYEQLYLLTLRGRRVAIRPRVHSAA